MNYRSRLPGRLMAKEHNEPKTECRSLGWELFLFLYFTWLMEVKTIPSAMVFTN